MIKQQVKTLQLHPADNMEVWAAAPDREVEVTHSQKLSTVGRPFSDGTQGESSLFAKMLNALYRLSHCH